MLDSTFLLKVVEGARGCLSASQIVQEVHSDFVLIAASLPGAEIVSFGANLPKSRPDLGAVNPPIHLVSRSSNFGEDIDILNKNINVE